MLFSGKLLISNRIFVALFAVLIAVLSHLLGLDSFLSEWVHSLGVFGAVFAGAFYTFGITTPTAFIVILEAMSLNGPFIVACTASASAALMDTALFMLLRDQLESGARKLIKNLRAKFGKHNTAYSLFGFFLFGSPLPDELALAFMQISEIKPERIAVIVFLSKLITLLIAYSAIYGPII